MEEDNTKPKKVIYLKRKPKQYAQLLFNILMIAAVSFLFMQNTLIKKELQVSKANEYKLFEEVNKLRNDVFDLKLNIIALDKIKLSKNTESQNKRRNKK